MIVIMVTHSMNSTGIDAAVHNTLLAFPNAQQTAKQKKIISELIQMTAPLAKTVNIILKKHDEFQSEISTIVGKTESDKFFNEMEKQLVKYNGIKSDNKKNEKVKKTELLVVEHNTRKEQIKFLHLIHKSLVKKISFGADFTDEGDVVVSEGLKNTISISDKTFDELLLLCDKIATVIEKPGWYQIETPLLKSPLKLSIAAFIAAAPSGVTIAQLYQSDDGKLDAAGKACLWISVLIIFAIFLLLIMQIVGGEKEDDKAEIQSLRSELSKIAEKAAEYKVP